MILHRFERRQSLPIPREEAWEFFSTPGNLALITPPALAMTIESVVERELHDGQIISYRVSPVPGWRARWVTEIKCVVRHVSFVDEQRSGPYRFWHHRHEFHPLPGGVEMVDLIHYALPMGGLGNLVAAGFVRRKVAEIFDHRARVLRERFGKLAGNE